MSDKTLKMLGDVGYVAVLTLHYGILYYFILMGIYGAAVGALALTIILLVNRDKYIAKITTVENKITALERKQHDQNI